jgi:hypothetical protein
MPCRHRSTHIAKPQTSASDGIIWASHAAFGYFYVAARNSRFKRKYRNEYNRILQKAVNLIAQTDKYTMNDKIVQMAIDRLIELLNTESYHDLRK